MITMDELMRRIAKGPPMTVAEKEALFQSCPEWVEQQREREAKHQDAVQKKLVDMKPEMDPIVIALREIGYEFETLSDFVNTDQVYPDAIPIFVKHLKIARHPALRETIARCLTGREARGLAGPVILSELREKQDRAQVRWALANALTAAADKNDVEGIKELLADPRNEDIRERLDTALKKAPKR